MKTKSGKSIQSFTREIRQQFLGHAYPAEKQASELRVVLYSHDTMGIGHMRRNLLIANRIKHSFCNANILVIAGAREASTFAQTAGIGCFTLPSFQKQTNGTYKSRHLGIPANEVLDIRSQAIRAVIQSYKPDLLIADKIPGGAGGELLPTLEWLSSRTSCHCVLGLREILDNSEKVIHQWQKMHAFEVIRQHFDSIWIYGDPAVYNAVSEYKFPSDIARRCNFTGYLDTRLRLSNLESPDSDATEPYVLCTVGGGQDGKDMPLHFIEAIRSTGRRSILLTGPYMPESVKSLVHSQAENIPSLQVIEFVNEGDLLVKDASHVVSMGGYNTLSAILSYKKPALIIPRVSPREEQLIRANRLAALGHVQTIHPDKLTSESITDWLNNPNPMNPRPVERLDLGGLDCICELIRNEFPNTTYCNPWENKNADSKLPG